MSEKQRLIEMNSGAVKWRHWGPYLSERQWGTVREDYSPGGTAWDHFPMTTLEAGPTDGVRTASQVFAMTKSYCA